MDIYTLFKVVFASVVATSVMTLVSYALSNVLNKQYREPVLLGYLLDSYAIGQTPTMRIYISWSLHYIIGIALVTAYHLLWQSIGLDKMALNLVFLAICTGLIGVVSWIVIFSICRYKPKMDYMGYFIQIFLVHILFTVIAVYTYCLL
ncbi:hypothetical protein FFWV33_16290 [Flavobacterium faecale]|uniref:DUF2938 domain-containing protein n=1 Tax=Flavobacterium faecale TaxID=1355330 RepID=A0A2S1LGU6_9FLAO|nr:hypothetical protein [Flavobacterium faecale]AWG22974.1 hypothetical protein FFWV33_16290 [Flavobacterium faecale]